MAISIKIVNPAKRQFIDPDEFPEHDGRAMYMTGVHAAAVGVLVCDAVEVSGHGYGALAGSWCGDPIIAATDAMEPDRHGIRTSTPDRPRRNLYELATEEFEDISLRAFAMVCAGPIGLVADTLAKDAAGPWGLGLFMKLGKVVMMVGCKDLDDALLEVFGEEWTGLYEDLARLDGVGDERRAQLRRLRDQHSKCWPWHEPEET